MLITFIWLIPKTALCLLNKFRWYIFHYSNNVVHYGKLNVCHTSYAQLSTSNVKYNYSIWIFLFKNVCFERFWKIVKKPSTHIGRSGTVEFWITIRIINSFSEYIYTTIAVILWSILFFSHAYIYNIHMYRW